MKLMLNGKEVSGMGHYVMAGDIKDATAEDSNVLSGKAYYNNNGKREGTMPNRGGMSAELAAGGSVSILEGYHNGEGVVRAQDLASQTAGTAAAANIEAGYTAWVNGSKVTGSLAKENVIATYVPNNVKIISHPYASGLHFKCYLLTGEIIYMPFELATRYYSGNSPLSMKCPWKGVYDSNKEVVEFYGSAVMDANAKCFVYSEYNLHNIFSKIEVVSF